MRKKQHIQLSAPDQAYLQEISSRGEQPARVYRRALALLELHRGHTYTAVAQTVGATKQQVSHWATCYRADGLSFLKDKPRSGRPRKLDSVDEAKITALACSDPPSGYSQWTLRLLADRAVELVDAESISYSKVRRILKKTNCNHT